MCLVDRSFPLPKTDNGSEIAPSKLTGQTAEATSRRDIKRCLPNALCPKTRREAVVCSRFGSFVGTSGIFFVGRRTEADGRTRTENNKVCGFQGHLRRPTRSAHSQSHKKAPFGGSIEEGRRGERGETGEATREKSIASIQQRTDERADRCSQ